MRTTSLPLAALALALATATPAAGGPEGPPYYDPARGIEKQQNAAKEAVKEMTGEQAVPKALEHLGDVSAYVRDAVYRALVSDFTNDQMKQLALGLRSKDPFVAGQVAEVLGTRRAKETREALEDALRRQKHEDVLFEICWALGEIGDKASADELEKVASKLSRSSYRVGGQAYVSLARCDPSNAVKHLRRGLEAKLAGVRIVCLAALVEADPKAGVEAALAQLDEKQQRGWEPNVLFQICESFRLVEKRRPHVDLYRKVVDRLVTLLPDKDGREAHEIGRTLRSVTGQFDLGDDALTWKSWWDANKSSFVPADLDASKDDHGDALSGEGGTRARYFGIPVYSKRLTFLLDLSGGMDRPVGGQDAKGPPRLTVAKEELSKTLQSLDDDVQANVIFFASKFYACAKQLLPVKRALRQILAYISEQQIPDKVHMNRGNLYDPILVAFETPEVDTIYLVTEGNPTEGRFIDRDRFVRHMMQHQKFTKTEVNSLFIGSARSAIDYLEHVSKPTGGRFFNVAELKGS